MSYGERSGSELWRKKVWKIASEEEGQEASYGGRRSGSEIWRKKLKVFVGVVLSVSSSPGSTFWSGSEL